MQYKEQIMNILERLGANGVSFTYSQVHQALGNAGLTNPSIWEAVSAELQAILTDENIVILVPTPLETPVFRLSKNGKEIKMSNKETVSIVLASNEYYLPSAGVTIQSIIKNASVDRNYEAIILESEIEDLKKESFFNDTPENITVRFVHVGQDIASKKFNYRVGYTPESFYRVLLPSILPDYDKVVYLDSDVVVNTDIAELFDTDLQQNLVAACQDPDCIKNCYQGYLNRDIYVKIVLGLEKYEMYFQSGVMIFNLKGIRKSLTVDEILDVACSEEILWGDQDVLNKLFAGKVLYLDMAWNTIVDGYGGRVNDVKEWAPAEITQKYLSARNNPKIIHFAGVQPWKNSNVDMNEYFWPVAKNSPFYKTILERVKEYKPETRINISGGKFAVSVIIPVYNSEDTLEETIQSVIGQTFDFEQYIQIILVNNATKDNSEEICLRYQAEYPDNVKYIKLEENHGPNGARVAGLEVAEGKYINFLDSDDKWEKNAFGKIFRFFEAHYFEIPFVACRIKSFGAWNSWDIRDDKFTRTRIVDSTRDYQNVVQNLCSCWIKRCAFKDIKLAVPSELIHAEDAMFLTMLVIKEKSFGLLKEAVFFYRRQIRGNSLITKRTEDWRWYTHTVRLNYEAAIEYAKNLYGSVPLHMQNWLTIELSDRVLTPRPKYMSDKEYLEYYNLLRGVAQNIDDYIIWENNNKGMSLQKKCAISILKYGDDFAKHIAFRNAKFFFDNLQMYSIEQKYRVSFEIMRIKNGALEIIGKTSFFFPFGDMQLFLRTDNGHKFYFQKSNYVNAKDRVVFFGKKLSFCNYINISVPLEYVKNLSLYAEYKGHIYNIGFGLGKFSCFTRSVMNDYYWKDGYVVTVKDQKIFVAKCGRKNAIKSECKLFKELWKKGRKKVALLRFSVFVARFFKKKQIWTVTDRITSAGDSGEEFFKYLCKSKPKGIKPYFIISSDSPDYKRIKKIGKVVKYGSWLHKFLYVLEDKTVSAMTNYWLYDFMAYNSEFLRSIKRTDFVHIQHGIIKDDISSSIGIFDKNMSLITTASKYEYDSMLQCPYGYTEKNICLTGLARHDKFWNTENVIEKTNVLLIVPTWRLHLAGPCDSKSDLFTYSKILKASSFFEFYNSLINDERLLNCMKKHNMTGLLQLHPNMQENFIDFQSNETIQCVECEKHSSPQKPSLVLTDYSSAVFDYSYQEIPVIYAQFDKEEFYAGHTYKEGYFNYETMGFGPVCYDYENTVQTIISAIENGCVMEEKYKKRVDGFFAFRDGKNCERIYQEILKLDEENP